MEGEKMKYGPENEDPHLEAVIDRFFSDLPQHEAPATLIPRVHELVAARARRPWWQCSYQDWETGTQISALVGGSIAFLTLWWGLSEWMPLLGAIIWKALGASLVGVLEPLLIVGTALSGFLQRSVGQIPLTFFYGAGVMVMLGYFFLISTGALLCRIVQFQKMR